MPIHNWKYNIRLCQGFAVFCLTVEGRQMSESNITAWFKMPDAICDDEKHKSRWTESQKTLTLWYFLITANIFTKALAKHLKCLGFSSKFLQTEMFPSKSTWRQSVLTAFGSALKYFHETACGVLYCPIPIPQIMQNFSP